MPDTWVRWLDRCCSLEWWFFTCISIMSGWLPNPNATVGAMAIWWVPRSPPHLLPWGWFGNNAGVGLGEGFSFQTAGVCYMLPLGLGTAVR